MDNAGQMFSGAKDQTPSSKAVPSLEPEKVFHVGQMRAGAVDCTISLKNANELRDSRYGKMRAGATELKAEEVKITEVEEETTLAVEVPDGNKLGEHLWEIPTSSWSVKIIKEVLGLYGVTNFSPNTRKDSLIKLLNAEKESKGLISLTTTLNE